MRLAACLLAAGLAGCSALLPRSDVATQAAWNSFEEAEAAIERIVPNRSTRAELAAARIEPRANPAVTILNFSEVAQRFNVGGGIAAEELDTGIRLCLTAGKSCSGYAIVVKRSERRRSGNFFLDFLNFRREVEVTGWTFNGLILLVGDLVVYTLHSGQPRMHEREVSRNPLGPLQGIGEGAGRELLSD